MAISCGFLSNLYAKNHEPCGFGVGTPLKSNGMYNSLPYL